MKKQQGFAHAVLIIGMVVALVGALGFIFWQNFIYEEPTLKETEVVQSSQKPASNAPADDSTNELYITELDKTLDLTNAKYDDITYTMTSINSDDKNKYVAAVYSKDLNERLVEDAKKSGSTVDTEYEKLSCNRSVSVFFQVYDSVASSPGVAQNPDSLSKDAELYVGSVGPCSASTKQLSQEYLAFRDWVKQNLK